VRFCRGAGFRYHRPLLATSARPLPGRRPMELATMIDLLLNPAWWVSLFSVTLVQVALGADNLIIITIIANKLPPGRRDSAVRIGLILAMAFRILLLAVISFVLKYATGEFLHFDYRLGSWLQLQGGLSGKAIVLIIGGLFLVWKGVKELRVKSKGVEQEVHETDRFVEVVTLIVGMNLLFSVDSILTVVGMTDFLTVMVGSVVISVALMLVFAKAIADFISQNPDFEILGLFVMLLIGFVLFLEGGHVAHLQVNGNEFPYIPQWVVIFMLVLMFSVDLYQNWWDRKATHKPVVLNRRKK
jgi:predicted tellurium resistance membrane protein TerC